MLIRLCNNGHLNPHFIDKMIVIKGIPENWIFRKRQEGDELLPPWEPDADVNIPQQIRNLCQPIKYCKWFPDIRHYDRTYQGFWDTRTVLGLKLDFNFGPAIQMWEKIVEYVEGTIPRTERMPQPVIVAVDHKSEFNPHTPRRNAQGHLEMTPSSIPVIDLTIYQKLSAPTITAASTPEPVIEMKTNVYLKCDVCNFETLKKNALSMHKKMKHRVKEKVTV